MEEKINIAELLKDCPQGMELYSPIFGDVYLNKIRPHLAIVVTTDKEQGDFKKEFLYDGRYGMNGECMLFPSRDKTTWEGFQRPFKKEDVLVYDNPNKPSKDMEESDKAKAPNLKGEDYSGKRFGYKIPDGYEFDKIENGKIILKPIKFKYPKTYDECCKVVNASPYIKLVFNIDDGQKYSYDVDNLQCYENIRRIKICRDAYWKIAGKELGLDKPWEPDLENEELYCIQNYNKQITISRTNTAFNKILIFPTEEMRDAFYENFKDLIEQCKELL